MALDKIVDSTKLDNALTATADAIRERGGHATGSESGAVITVTDALAAPVVALSVDIEPVQSGSGDPSPSNERSISGWDTISIWNKPTHDTSADPTVTIQLGQTVYGGTLDVTAGTMTVDRRFITLDGVNQKVTAGYAALGPKRLPIVYLNNQVKAINQTDYDHIRSSYLKTGNFMNAENSIGIGNGGNALPVHIGSIQGTDGTHGYNSDAELVAAANAYLQEHPLQICYKLATPIEITLTPAQITMLAGTNNVWSNAGNITLKYLIDSELIPFDLENETGFADAIGSIIGVDDIIVIGDYGLCLNNFTVSGNICTSAAGTVSGNTLIAV